MTLILENPILPGDLTPKPAEKSGKIAWTLPGFGPMARICTTIGKVPAIALRVRDSVLSGTGQALEITGLDRIRLDKGFLDSAPDAQPILIRAGSLAQGVPGNDIIVSPEQYVGVTRDSMVRARDLLGRRGISRVEEEMMTYTTIACSAPALVKMEGLWARIGD